MSHFPLCTSAAAFTPLMAKPIPQAANDHQQGKTCALAITSKGRNPTALDSGV